MSRIGKLPIPLTDKVEFSIDADNVVTVKGDKGTSSLQIHPNISVEKTDGEILVKRNSEVKQDRALHGLYRSLINNMVVGVSTGYKLELELVGVGFKATCAGNVLDLNLGYSHNIVFALPAEVKGAAETAKGKNPIITLESNDKQLIGQVAAKLRSLRKIEPYKGKGVRFVGEQILRKAGKTASK